MSKGTNSALGWLADAPLFIDEKLIGAMYDAIVRPDSKQGSVTYTFQRSNAVEANAQGVGKVELGLADWLVKVAPFLQAKASVEAGAGIKGSTANVLTESVTVTPIDNPYRQLIQLTVHYLANYQDRLLYATKATIEDEISNMPNGELPKPLVFLDLPSKADALKAGESPTMIVPMAGEFSNGTIKLMFEQYMVDVMDLKRPDYLSWSKEMDLKAYEDAKRKYWGNFAKSFKSSAAMVMVEQAGYEMGRIRWIDYQLLVDENGSSLHLHFSPNERESAGVFAHRLIERSHLHGLRLVGTISSGPSLNVMAVFDN